MTNEIEPWFMSFYRNTRCLKHDSDLGREIGVVPISAVGYIAAAKCQRGEQVTLVGVRTKRPLSNRESSIKALAVWTMAAPDLTCGECGSPLGRQYLIAVTGKLDGSGDIVARCDSCRVRFGFSIYWTHRVVPIERDEVLNAHELLKHATFSDLLRYVGETGPQS